MNARILLLALLMSGLCLPGALADEVVLKSGKSVKGVIVQRGDTYIRIQTAEGKRLKIERSEIELISEDAQIGVPELDEKVLEIDQFDPSALVEVAEWAKDKKIRGWNLLCMKALELDDEHAGAHEMLGHSKVGDKWYTTEKSAREARKAAREEEMRDKGYLPYRGGWIQKEDKALADKDRDAFVQDDDGLWRNKDEVMREQGYILVSGKWIRAGTPEDKASMESFKEKLGEDIWVITTKHFRLHVQQYPPEKVDEFGKLAEKAYDWFLDFIGEAPDYNVFRGNKGNLYMLKDKNTALEWFKHFGPAAGLNDQFFQLMSKGSGNVQSPGRLVGIIVPRQDQGPEHLLVHDVGHFLIAWFSRGLDHTPAWLEEAFGHMAEHDLLDRGEVTCTTATVYAAGGAVANKRFTTRDAPTIAKGMARDPEPDYDFVKHNALDLNSLNGNHMTKGWTLIEWLRKLDQKKLVEWLAKANTMTLEDALTEIFGWDPTQLDKEWAKFWRSAKVAPPKKSD